MTWTYAQRQGALRHDGKLAGSGYSGHGPGKNNTDLEQTHNIGPIPRGRWTIEGPPINGTSHGPYVLRLVPCPGTETFGRDGFLIHGDMKDPALQGQASLGCLILPYQTRVDIWESGDRDLGVVEFDAGSEEVA